MCNKSLYTMCELCQCLNERLPTLLHVSFYGLTGKASVLNTLCKLFFQLPFVCSFNEQKMNRISLPFPSLNAADYNNKDILFIFLNIHLFLEICSTFDQYASSLRLFNLQQYY